MDPRTEALTIKELWRKISWGDFSSVVDLENMTVTVPKSVDDSSSQENSIPQFPSIGEQLVFLTAASLTVKDYVHRSRRSRGEIKKKNYYHGSGYLSNKELAMIGELDGEEAEIIYKGSQENGYKHPFFEGLVHSYNGERMRLGFPPLPRVDHRLSSNKEKRFFDEHIVFPDITEPKYECILEDHVRREMLAGHESYVVLLEEAMMTKREKKKTEILARATDQRFPNFVW